MSPEEAAHRALGRSLDRLARRLTVMQRHLLALLAAENERQERAARDHMWAATVDRPAVKYLPVPA